MPVVNPRPTPVHSRRRILGWTATAAMAVAAGNLTGMATAMAQATPDATTSTLSTFLDANLVHDIAVAFDQEIYDAMIATLADTGDKEWIEATVTIDGDAYEKTGMRLKGNSSLGGLGGGVAPAIPGEVLDGSFSEGIEDMPDKSRTGEFGTNEVTGRSASADAPEQLPWLIRLDKYVEGQAHQGITDVVIRSNHSATSLNEAVALDLLSLAGLASQRAAATRFVVNNSDPALRLAIELPNETWMADHFPAGGLLYKAEAGGDFSYRGDDPASYKDVFDLEAGGTGDDATDFQPLFEFLAFLNDSDDETFAAGLPDHLDVDEFAIYLAMMNLIGNFDDISGPGNNAYLHVDPGAEQFTVVPWDMNLAFGGGGGEMRILPGGATPEAHNDAQPASRDGDDDDQDDLEIFGIPIPLPGSDKREVRIVGPGQGPSNKLVERWNAADGNTDLVDETRTRLHSELYDSGTAAGVLARWAQLLTEQAADLVDDATIATESDAIARYFTQEP